MSEQLDRLRARLYRAHEHKIAVELRAQRATMALSAAEERESSARANVLRMEHVEGEHDTPQRGCVYCARKVTP